MTTTTRPATARRQARTRTEAGRRSSTRLRRRVLALCGISLVAVAVAVALPTVRKAFKELSLPLSDQAAIRHQAAVEHLDPALIAAVIYAETKFDPRPSSAGALGLMQLMPQTAEYLARRSGGTTFTIADLATPNVNIAYGSYYLRYLLDRYGGSEVPALAAYNAGQANVDRWLANARLRGRELTTAEIPFPETRDYVLRVLRAQRDYRQTYAGQLGYG